MSDPLRDSVDVDSIKAHAGTADQAWVQVQTRTFTAWCNTHLKKKGESLDNLLEDLNDGVELIVLLEVLSDKKLGKYNTDPKHVAQKLENLNLCLEFLKKEDIKLVGIGAKDIHDGNMKLILGLIWTIILRFHIQEYHPERRGSVVDKSGASKELLEWVRSKIPDYKINNFTSDWADGRAITALAKAVEPTLGFEVPAVFGSDAVANASVGMKAAADKMDIPLILSPEDMVTHPDQLSNMTYISYFRTYENARKAAAAAASGPSAADKAAADKAAADKAAADKAAADKAAADKAAADKAKADKAAADKAAADKAAADKAAADKAAADKKAADQARAEENRKKNAAAKAAKAANAAAAPAKAPAAEVYPAPFKTGPRADRPSSQVSNTIVWDLIRNHNAYRLASRRGRGKKTIFSTEPNNITNRHTSKWSGLANERTVLIVQDKSHLKVETTDEAHGHEHHKAPASSEGVKPEVRKLRPVLSDAAAARVSKLLNVRK